MIYCEVETQPNSWGTGWNGGCPVVWNCKNNDRDVDGYAYDFIDGIRYRLKESVAEAIKQSASISGDIVVPSSVGYKNESYDVKSIGVSAFANCNNLTSVKISEGIESIGANAFSHCNNLTRVEISDTVVNIGRMAFYYCRKLTDVNIPYGIETIERATFCQCNSLAQITIPETVTNIESLAFGFCTSLTSIIIPNTVVSMQLGIFPRCNALTVYCEATEKPSEWGDRWNPDNLPVVWDCKNNDRDNEGYVYAVIGGIRYRLKDGIADIVMQSETLSGDIVIPLTVTYKGVDYNVTNITDRAFYKCVSITSVTIENNVESIGNMAFASCSEMISVIIPETVINIEQGAFNSCNKLTVYCEAEEQPIEWDSRWNGSNRPVIWGYKETVQ